MIFYESFYEALKNLPDKERLESYDAICKYGCTGEEPDVSGVVAVVFTLVKPQIDAAEKRAVCGKMGGRPKKNKAEPEAEPETLGFQPSEDQGEKPQEDESGPKAEPEAPKKKPGRPKKEKEPRHKYGQNGKVLLSDTELEKLKHEFPDTWEQWIERVDGYCQQMGKGYSDYLQTIRNWAKKDQNQKASGGNHSARKNRFHNFQQRIDAGGTGITLDDMEDLLVKQGLD